VDEKKRNVKFGDLQCYLDSKMRSVIIAESQRPRLRQQQGPLSTGVAAMGPLRLL
jgi:hypothetical protein